MLVTQACFQQEKMASKFIRIASTDILNLKIFLGEATKPLPNQERPPLLVPSRETTPPCSFHNQKIPMRFHGRATL